MTNHSAENDAPHYPSRAGQQSTPARRIAAAGFTRQSEIAGDSERANCVFPPAEKGQADA